MTNVRICMDTMETVDGGSVLSIDLTMISFLPAQSSLYRKRNGCKISRPQRRVADRAS